MGKTISLVIIVGGLIIFSMMALSQLNQSAANREYARAEREYARAHVIAEQGQARLDAAVGLAGLAAMGFPYFFTFAIMILAAFIAWTAIAYFQAVSESRRHMYMLELQRYRALPEPVTYELQQAYLRPTRKTYVLPDGKDERR